MTNRAAKVTQADVAPLYASEDQIAVFVIGPARAREWPGIVAALERQGFPAINSVMGGRYLPSVRKWLDHWEGADQDQSAPGTDGIEDLTTWNAQKRPASNDQETALRGYARPQRAKLATRTGT